MFLISKSVFVLSGPFQPSLMLMGKARSLPRSGTPERCPASDRAFQLVNCTIKSFKTLRSSLTFGFDSGAHPQGTALRVG